MSTGVDGEANRTVRPAFLNSSATLRSAPTPARGDEIDPDQVQNEVPAARAHLGASRQEGRRALRVQAACDAHDDLRGRRTRLKDSDTLCLLSLPGEAEDGEVAFAGPGK